MAPGRWTERGVGEEGGPAGVCAGGGGPQWAPLGRVAGNTTSRISDPDWAGCCNLVKKNESTSPENTRTRTHTHTHTQVGAGSDVIPEVTSDSDLLV